MVILAGKIDGQTSELGLFTHKNDDSGKKTTIDDLVASQIFNTQDYGQELPKMIEVFLEEHEVFLEEHYDGQKDIYGCCFGIAGPIDKGQAQINRQDFQATFTEHDCRKKLRYPTVPGAFINDMEAIGYGIFLGDGEKQLQELYRGNQASPQERRALMLVSGGLGQALWYWDENKKRLSPISSEGGHADFAPRTKKEIDLLSYLKEQDKPISYEYVLSSPGLVRICNFLQNTGNYGNQNPNNAEAIIQQALQGNPLCKEVLKMFISIWGAEAGNMALRYKAKGGVYIGGIPIPIETLREDNTFVNAFTDKEGIFKTYNEGISVKVFQEENIIMWGAARYAINAGFVTKGKLEIMQAKRSKEANRLDQN